MTDIERFDHAIEPVEPAVFLLAWSDKHPCLYSMDVCVEGWTVVDTKCNWKRAFASK
jgi:hypothetical protein